MNDRIKRFEAMVERFADRAPPRFSLARALHDAERHADAEPHYAEALRLQPDLMMAAMHRAECLFETGRFEEARTAAQLALSMALKQGHTGPQADAENLLEEIADELG
jgi:tetratricopeptide (TPR) repeat protein